MVVRAPLRMSSLAALAGLRPHTRPKERVPRNPAVQARAEQEARLAQCVGKEKLSRANANLLARKSKTKLDVFRCRHCDGWHVGSPR